MAIPAKDRGFFEYTKDHRFAQMYPLLAREIVENYDVKAGKCLDIGTGNAALSIEISKLTGLDIFALDREPEVIEMARNNCVLHKVPDGRIHFLNAPVEDIPLPNGSIDLVISRGSIPFWDDHVSAFREIHRVLAEGGVAFVGCGFSRYQTLEEVKAMRPAWSPDVMEERTRWKKGTFLFDTLKAANVPCFRMLDDGYGTWVEVSKHGKEQ